MCVVVKGSSPWSNLVVGPCRRPFSPCVRQNPALRFANTTFWWVLLSSVQLLWKWAIYERYLSEPREQFFVDMYGHTFF
jgi:hypothetical protein